MFGQHSRWGAELAAAEANAKGGVLGRKVEIDFQDNRCNPAEAVKSVTQMLAEKKYVAIFDGLCSSAALAIMPLVERAGIPLRGGQCLGPPPSPSDREWAGTSGRSRSIPRREHA
jgi:ABC-type branched-chain amino acid transport systems, periplasmic component